MEYFVSTDGLKFVKVADVNHESDSASGERQLKKYSASFGPLTASFVKVIAHKGQTADRKPTWIFIDEIEVE
jgi:hypothetical protein